MANPIRNGRLMGKRTIVTGSAMGLGEAVARRFAHEGAAVVCVDVKPVPNEQTVQSLLDQGGQAYSVIGDVSSSADVQRMSEEAEDFLGGIDVLVNNAGVIPSRETVVETTEADWDETFRVNAKGTFLMSRSIIPRMIQAGGGSIVNMSSIAGLVGLPVRPAYCASKGAVSLLTRQMAVDFGKHKVRVNAINPSFVVTDINREMFDKLKADSKGWQDMLDLHPLGRLGEPDDIAHAAVYLASDESRWVTGVLLPVDGGYTGR